MAGSIPEYPDSDRAASDADAQPAEDADLEHRSLSIPLAMAGKRLDQVLARLLTDFSRARLQAWIRDGLVTVDGRHWRPRDKVLGGEQVEVSVVMEAQVEAAAQSMPLDILYEDLEILVVNKPAGLVVHPAAGNWDGTLLNGLLYHDPDLARLPRCGIVHRLDKDTSGLLVVAKTLRAHGSLVAQLQARSVRRQYRAVVHGVPVIGDTVDAPIGRHPTQRMRMAVTPGGRPSVTHYRVAERFRAHSLLEVSLETGRTHQIRVHLTHVHYPILGDPVYGGRLRLPAGATADLLQVIRSFRRQALHAWRLSLSHPASAEQMAWEAPLPADMQALLGFLREDAR